MHLTIPKSRLGSERSNVSTKRDTSADRMSYYLLNKHVAAKRNSAVTRDGGLVYFVVETFPTWANKVDKNINYTV
jgi:hypothetical protein